MIQTVIAACSLTDGDYLQINQKSIGWEKIEPANAENPMLTGRRYFGMTVKNQNEIYVFGGYNGSYLNDLWKYTVSTNNWEQLIPGNAPQGRSGHSFVLMNNNKIILFGGGNGTELYLNDTWEYDISSNIWTNLQPVDPIPSARANHTMAAIADGKALLVGGNIGSNTVDNELWEYSQDENVWQLITPSDKGKVLVGRYGHGMVYTENDEIYVFGGTGTDGYLNDVFENDKNYDYIWFKSVKAGAPGLPEARTGLAVSFSHNGLAVMFGGFGATYFGDTWLYTIKTSSWTQVIVDENPAARQGHSMVYVGDQRVLLFGGVDVSNQYLNDIWILYTGAGEL